MNVWDLTFITKPKAQLPLRLFCLWFLSQLVLALFQCSLWELSYRASVVSPPEHAPYNCGRDVIFFYPNITSSKSGGCYVSNSKYVLKDLLILGMIKLQQVISSFSSFPGNIFPQVLQMTH